LIGADIKQGRLGGYSGPGNGTVSILTGIKQIVNDSSEILYSEGPGIFERATAPIASKWLSHEKDGKIVRGLSASYFNQIHPEGKPTLIRDDAMINFHWTLFPPADGLPLDFYSVIWNGKLTAPETGNFNIGLEGNDGFRLYLNDSLLIDRWAKQSDHVCLTNYAFTKGKEYAIRVEFYEPNGSGRIKLIPIFLRRIIGNKN